ncbi:MAG: hypothetical protein U5L04_02050 [Trueperaceae bacterium]|nr:hypothetical protein [Trueperaceae bacterium]
MTRGTQHIFDVLREIDLSKIQTEAERRFQLLVVGTVPLAERVAEALSLDDDKAGVHPWIVVRDVAEAPSGLTEADLVVMVSEGLEPSPAHERWLQQSYQASRPILNVIVGETAERTVGAELPRPLENARVLLPRLDDDTVARLLVPELVRSLPEGLELAFARHLPLLRTTVMQQLIEQTARANALYSATTGLAGVVPILNLPLNVADFIVLTKNQLVMAYKIALAGGKTGEPQALVGEMAGVLGGGLLLRQLARELVGLVPVWGIVPNVVVSYAGTWTIGRGVEVWVTRGERATQEELRRTYRQAVETGRVLARQLVEAGKARGRALWSPKSSNRSGPNINIRVLPPPDKTDTEQGDAASGTDGAHYGDVGDANLGETGSSDGAER